MPTDLQVKRTLLHTRQVICQGYMRDDGLWDIEGSLADVRGVDCLNLKHEVLVPKGQTLHGMRLRITVDDAMTIVEAQAITEHSPHGECRSASAGYAALKGLTIGPGFLAKAKERFRGINGCTHLSELIGPVATTAYQTIFAAREQVRAVPGTVKKGPALRLVDSCHAWRRGGEAFNAHYQGEPEN